MLIEVRLLPFQSWEIGMLYVFTVTFRRDGSHVLEKDSSWVARIFTTHRGRERTYDSKSDSLKFNGLRKGRSEDIMGKKPV